MSTDNGRCLPRAYCVQAAGQTPGQNDSSRPLKQIDLEWGPWMRLTWERQDVDECLISAHKLLTTTPSFSFRNYQTRANPKFKVSKPSSLNYSAHLASWEKPRLLFPPLIRTTQPSHSPQPSQQHLLLWPWASHRKHSVSVHHPRRWVSDSWRVGRRYLASFWGSILTRRLHEQELLLPF